nr:reverse transcriptase domain-containing protein [Tanacetum cinerariifolium]
MLADSAVTYTFVYSEARSWSIPSEDPYEEAAQQLLKQAPLPAEDEAPIEAYILEDASVPTPLLPPSFLSPCIRPLHTKVAMAQMRAAVPSTYHSLLQSGTPPLLCIPLPVPSNSRRVEIPEADTAPRKRLLLTAPIRGCEARESSTAAAGKQPGPTMARSVDCSFVDTMETRFRDTDRRMMSTLEMVNMRVSYQVDVCSRESLEFYSRHHDAQKDRAAVKAEIEVLRIERDLLTKENGTKTNYQHVMLLEVHFAMIAIILEWVLEGQNELLVNVLTLTFSSVNHYTSKALRELPVFPNVAITTELMDQKIRTFTEREITSKRKLENTLRSTQNQQQQPNKRQNTGWVYTTASGERNEYAGTLPLCNKCKFHHNGQCTIKCANCKRVGHLTRDCRSPAATNNH